MNTFQSKNDTATVPVLPDDVPVTMPELPLSLVINTSQQFKAISDEMRSRILGIIQNQPATAKQIADRLGATPGGIGHHLRVLEAAGLAKIVARRLVRGIVANYYTRTARIFTYDLPREVTGGRSVNLEIMTRALNELAEAEEYIEEDACQTEGFPHIRLSPERAKFYSERLQVLVGDILNETPDPNGKVYGILVAMFMAPAYMQGPSTSIPSESIAIDGDES